MDKSLQMKKKSWIKFGWVLVLMTGFALYLGLPPEVLAATIVVNSTADEVIASNGACTLREAINNANSDSDTTGGDCVAGSGADVITLPAGTYTLTIANPGGAPEDGNASGDLDITASVTINGAGASNTIIEAGPSAAAGIDRVINILNANPTVLNDLTIQHGNTPNASFPNLVGGGIYSQGIVNLNRVRVINNISFGSGGGIFANNSGVNGLFRLHQSEVSGNSSGIDGGGIQTGINDLILEDTTVSGNQAVGSGSAIYVGNVFTEVIIDNSTIANNTNGSVGLFIDSLAEGIRMRNSIVTGNDNNECSINPAVITAGTNNLIDDASCSVPSLGAVTNFGPLGFNGGQTQTHILNAGSNAIDTGDNGACTDSDQRGFFRPAGGICDIGAYELETASYDIEINFAGPTTNVIFDAGTRTYYPTGSGAQIEASDIEAELANGNVTIDTNTGASSEEGVINWVASANIDIDGLPSGRRLHLKAADDIRVNGVFIGDFTGTPDGQIELRFEADRTLSDGYVYFGQATDIDTNGGALFVTGRGVNSGTVTPFENGGVIIDNETTIVADGGVTIDGTGGSLGSAGVIFSRGGELFSAGSMTINGTSGDGSSNNHGILVTGTGPISSESSKIRHTGPGIANLNGISASTSTAGAGILVDDSGKIENFGTGSMNLVGNSTLGNGIQVSNGLSEIFTDSGPLTLTGTSDQDGHGILVNASVLSNQGSITLDGSGGSGGVTNSVGVLIDGGQVTSSSGGSIEIIGSGGSNAGPNNNGVQVVSAGRVQSLESTIAITGTGGTGTTFNNGVRIEGLGTVVETGVITPDTISINGIGGTGTQNNSGVLISDNATIDSNAEVTLVGTGGQGSDFNDGVRVESDGAVSVTSANLTIDGTSGGVVAGTNNHGVHLFNGGQVETVTSGDISIVADVGVSGYTGGFNHAFYIADSTVSSAGNIDITADSDSTGSNAVGLFMETTGDPTSISTTAGGDIEISTNSLTLPSGVISGTGQLQLQPIDVLDDFELTDVDVATFQDGFSQITIGRDDSVRDVLLTAAGTGTATFSDSLVILVSSSSEGSTVNLTGVELQSSETISITSGGNVTFDTIATSGATVEILAVDGPISGRFD